MKRAAAALAGGLLVALLGSPSRAAAPHVELGSALVHIPFDYRDHLITVSARINGAGPFRLMVDTGATLAVTPAVAKAAHLTTRDDTSLEIAGNGPGVQGGVRVAPVERIDLGGVAICDVSTLVFDQQLEDGIIGYPLFEALRVTIDFPGREIDVRAAQDQTPLPGRTVPMFISNGHFPTVAGSIDGEPGMVRIDTGANRSLLVNSTFAHDHKLTWQRTGFESYGTAVGGQTHESIVAPLRFTLGRFEFGRVDSSVSLLTGGLSADPLSAATIGTRLLEHYVVTFDYPHQAISFAPP
jgi:predicted aspartyl protease